MKIVGLNKKNNKIFLKLEDSSVIETDKDCLNNTALSIGDDLDEETIGYLVKCNQIKKIKLTAFRILSKRLHSKFELRQKLLKKGYHSSEIEEILIELQNENYIDDERYSKLYFEEQISHRKNGLIKIVNNLRKKGISKRLIQELESEHAGNTDYFNNACHLAEKKLNSASYKYLDKVKIKSKLFMYLKQKGFENDIIFRVFSTFHIK